MSSRAGAPPHETVGTINGTDWNPFPTMLTAEAIAFANRLGVKVTRTMLRRATERRQVVVTKISTRNTYSEQGVVDWIMSMARGGESVDNATGRSA